MKSRLVLSRHVAGIHALAALALFCQISNVQKVFTSNRNNGGLQTFPAYFNASGLSSFWEAYEQSTAAKAQRLVLMCAVGELGLCGGIGDRLRGIPYAVAVSLLSNRQLVIDTSLMSTGNLPGGLKPSDHFYLVDGECNPTNLNRVIASPLQTLYVTANCMALDPGAISSTTSMSVSDPRVLDLLLEVRQECHVPYVCGAAVAHSLPLWAANMASVWRFVQTLPMLTPQKYTGLHIRAGGSSLDYDEHVVKALPWEDAYASDIPRLWVRAFKDMSVSYHCQNPIAVVSDSSRLMAELQHQAYDRLPIVHCCTQPLHRDRTQRPEFFWQEVLDLFVLARAREIIGGNGGFAVLGQHWMGNSDRIPPLVVAKSEGEIKEAMRRLLDSADCQEMKTGRETNDT